MVTINTADDIGKRPDQNVSETLSRIPGVQISRVEGAGQQISVRGIDLNRLIALSERTMPRS